MSDESHHPRSAFRRWLRIAAALAAVVFAVVAALRAHEWGAVTDMIASGGYPALFVAAVISGFNLAVPVPLISFYGAIIAAGLDPWLTILIISVGMACADGLGFAIGIAAREMDTGERLARWLRTDVISRQSPWLIVGFVSLYAAFVPLPNEIIVVPLALAGVRALHILPGVLIGNVIFNGLAAWGVLQLANGH
jgi:membrane protein YqaA with SNARE-associated domain